MTSWKDRIFLSPDDGGSGAGTEAPAENGNPTSQPTSQPTSGESGAQQQNPAYFSQFRKENRERFASLSKYKSLDDLADAALKGDSAQEPDYSGYLKIPTGDSTKEEIKDFLGKLGVPEGPDKYTIPQEESPTTLVQGMEKTLREAAFRSGMTDAQTKSMWGVFRALVDTATQQGEAYMKDRKDNFDSRYEGLFRDQYQQKAQRDAAIKESLGYFRTFLSDTGLGKVLEETGAIYDERIVKALADYQKRNRGSYMHGGTGPKAETQSTRLHYSADFEKAFGRRN